MVCRIATISIEAVRPRVIADFWREALGWQEIQADDTGMTLAPPNGVGPIIEIGAVPSAKHAKNRLHLDLRADGSSVSQELERLLSLGARRIDVGQDASARWHVLADPEGNEFCLLDRTVAQVQ